ncbi:MAG: carotenoid biosynthesis protein [Archangium sp.]|nr:carotenoid biosynthesis protein [Archangium sp.]
MPDVNVLEGFAMVWASLALGVTLTALVRRRRPARSTGVDLTGTVVLRPIDSPTQQELLNLAEPVPAGVRQIVLCPFRPRLAAGVEWLASDPPVANRKLGHLQYAFAALRLPFERVVIVDGDVRIDEALLTNLVGGLDEGAAAAWAAPRPEAGGLARGVLVQSLHSFDVLAAIGPAPQAMCGKAVALGADAVEVLRTMPACAGEDLELSSRLHARGLPIKLAGQARIPGRAAGQLQRFTRWMQVLRAHRPGLFPAVPVFFACTPLLLPLAAVSGDVLTASIVAAVLVARTVVAALAERTEASPQAPWWWLAGEVVLLVAWVGALLRGGRVVWRGRTLELGPGGSISTPVLRPTAP